jgi:hypothetical protein
MMIRASICVLLLMATLHAGASECAAAAKSTVGGGPIQAKDWTAGAFGPIIPSEVPRIRVDELQSRLNDPSLVVVDVRTGAEWNDSQKKIKGAVRELAENVSAWAATHSKDETIVLYCS